MTNRDFDPITDAHQQQFQQNPNSTISILSDEQVLTNLKNQNKLPYLNTSGFASSVHSDGTSESGSSIAGSHMFEDSPTHSHPTNSSQSLDGSATTWSQHSDWNTEDSTTNNNNSSQIYGNKDDEKNHSS